MKRILYIVPHRPNRSPGQRFRCEHFIPVLKDRGYEITYSNIISKWDDLYFYQKGKYLVKAFIFFKAFLHRCYDVLRARNYDAIFIYREAFMIGSTFFEKGLAKSKKPIIFDFDDSIWIQDISDGNKNLSWMKNASKTDDIIQLSKLIIVGNKYLADHALKLNKNVVIIPTTIDTNHHKPTEKTVNNKICIGWTGSETTIKHLKLIIPVFKRLKEKFADKISFIQISNVDFSLPEIDLHFIPWNAETEIADLQKIDIGIMPLPDDEWAKGKCGFKGLQYMAMEIATVMSPVGVNTEIIENGKNGFFASTEQEWFDILCKLIEDPQLRIEIGKKGRETVIKRYSIDSQKDKYLSIFKEITN
ncbi:MAG: glycosyltransferase family 4 protein [Bacteroidales bacterium]|nr:glycosyltransferase family 4 protein [Bacteroidales bacterium]